MNTVATAALFEVVMVMSALLGFIGGYGAGWWWHRMQRRKYRAASKHMHYLEQLAHRLQEDARARRTVAVVQNGDKADLVGVRRPFIRPVS